MIKVINAISIIFGLFGLISLEVYVWETRKIEVKIIQIFQRVMDKGDFQIIVVVTNIGNRVAENCSVKIYVEDNPVQDLSFPSIDSPIGKIGLDWPTYTSFEIHRNTPIWLRGYLGPNYEGKRVHVRLFLDDREVDRSNTFTLTKVKT